MVSRTQCTSMKAPKGEILKAVQCMSFLYRAGLHSSFDSCDAAPNFTHTDAVMRRQKQRKPGDQSRLLTLQVFLVFPLLSKLAALKGHSPLYKHAASCIMLELIPTYSCKCNSALSYCQTIRTSHAITIIYTARSFSDMQCSRGGHGCDPVGKEGRNGTTQYCHDDRTPLMQASTVRNPPILPPRPGSPTGPTPIPAPAARTPSRSTCATSCPTPTRRLARS